MTEEALTTPTSFVVSYHPTIFQPLSSLTLSNPLQSNLLRCAASGVSIFSPHTSLDSVWGGINDWLGAGVANAPWDPLSSGQAANVALIGEAAADGKGGSGRVVTLSTPVSMKEMESRIKKHLSLEQSR